jgi:hypothetical protein
VRALALRHERHEVAVGDDADRCPSVGGADEWVEPVATKTVIASASVSVGATTLALSCALRRSFRRAARFGVERAPLGLMTGAAPSTLDVA